MPIATHSDNWQLKQLLHGFADVDDNQDCEIQSLSNDSRCVNQGSLFLACAGHNNHGLDFIDEVYQSGVAAIVWEPAEGYSSQQLNDEWAARVPHIAIADLSWQLGLIADRFYHHPSGQMEIIGITGTDGKTSCCHFIATALQQQSDTPVGVIGTLGYGCLGYLETASHTTPDALRVHQLLQQMNSKGVNTVVMEVSSHALHQGRVQGVHFNVAVLTNISRDHLDYHGDMVSYAAAKRRLFAMPGLEHAVLNNDDEYGEQWAAELKSCIPTITYGTTLSSDTQHSVSFTHEILDHDGLHWEAVTPWGHARLHSSLYGRFNLYNLSAVISTLGVLGLSWDEITKQVASLKQIAGRMEIISPYDPDTQPVAVIDFAHTAAALRQVLLALTEHGFGKIWCVFGCGGDRDQGKRPLMGSMAESLADCVILTDDNPRTEDGEQIIADILSGISTAGNVHIERDRAAAIEWAIKQANPQDIVLIAGKGHEDYQIIGNKKLPFSDKEAAQTVLKRGLH